jgi:GntR family transcriptional regulator
MDQIRFLIASGKLNPGDPLPSTRALSADLGVNPMTISKAYSYLERDGVVERRPGRPLLVREFGNAQKKNQQMDQLRESLLNPVGIVKQLGIKNAEAIDLFEEMLKKSDGSDPGKDNS